MIEVKETQAPPGMGQLCIDESALAGIFGAPSDRPLVPIAFKRLAAACRTARLGRFGAWASQLEQHMHELAVRTPERPQDLALLMDGRRTEYPIWAKLVGRADFSGLGLELLGYEFCLAMTQQRRARRSVLDRAVAISLVPDIADRRYVAKLEAEANGQCSRRQAGVPAHVLRVNSIVRATVAVEMSAKDPEKRQAVDGARTLPAPVVRAVAGWLEQQDDATSIVTMIAFMTGLTWDTAKLLPLVEGGKESRHVALVDVTSGVFCIDLNGLLPRAKARANCDETGWVVVRPLPERIVVLLRELCARNPAAARLGDLLPKTSNRQEIGAFGRRVTIAKFLASRGLAALEAGLDRKIAAYCTGAFSLLGKSEHHYLKLTSSEIEQGCARLYAWLNWTSCVRSHTPSSAVGSGFTPSKDSVLSLEAHHAGRVEQLRVGRRTTLGMLLDFHNSYSSFCVHRAALFTLARAADEYGFDAAAFHPDNSFATLIDKRAGPFGCATPLPMPIVLTTQIALWRAHLQALDQRLEKMGWHQQDARGHLRRVLDGGEGTLFFEITSDGQVVTPGSADVFSGTDLKGDGYRHFVANELRLEGLQTEVIEAACRHVVPHATVFSIASVAPPAQWLRDAAQALDALAARLGLRPVHGLRRLVR